MNTYVIINILLVLMISLYNAASVVPILSVKSENYLISDGLLPYKKKKKNIHLKIYQVADL